jgi:hypothetical protein
MTHSDITLDQLRAILHYSPETGKFIWKVKTCRKVVPGATAGYIKFDGYRIIKINKRNYRANRLAWFYITGNWPTGDIDHIDGDPRNDAFTNLRDVSTAGNIQNQKRATARNKTGGLLGVSKLKRSKRWRARICTNGVHKLIGWFDTPEEAHQAYVEAKRLHHLTCTI